MALASAMAKQKRNLGSKLLAFRNQEKKPVLRRTFGCPMVPLRLLWGWIQTYETHRNSCHLSKEHPARQLSSPKIHRPRQIGCQITFHLKSALFRVKLLMYCRVFTLGQTNNSMRKNHEKPPLIDHVHRETIGFFHIFFYVLP